MADGLSFERADLMAQTAWLHALARALAAQPADAEDAAQATSLRALQHGPRDAGRWRAFLAVALRNTLALTHRAERRRRAHERHAASPEAATESTDDLAARLELHRHLATLVLALPTPQRELVLRHYFAGEGIAALAQHTRTTTAAVRGHLHRARARLRAQLEASDGEARRGFALLLASEAGEAWIGAGALMVLTTKAKVFAALGTAAAAWLLWTLVTPGDDALGAKDVRPAPATASVASAPDPTPGPAVVRTEVPTSIATRDVPCQLVGLRPAAPWTAAVTIELEGTDAATAKRRRAEQQATPGPDGSFALHLPPWSESCGSFHFRIRAEDPLYLGLDKSERSVALASSQIVASPIYTIEVQPVGVLTGKVVDGDGAPVPAVRVLAFARIEGRPHGGSLGTANTGRDGSYHLPVAATTDVVVIAVPMREASSRDPTAVGKHGAVADDGTRRDDLLPGWRAGASRFGSRVELEPIVVTPPAWFAGSVVHADQTPAFGTRISGGMARTPSLRLWDLGPEYTSLELCPDGRAAFSLFATVDGEGRFRLPTVGGARLKWAVQLCDGPLLMQADATAPCNLQVVVPRQPVTVRVQCGGKAVCGAMLESPADQEESQHCVHTDERGEALVLRTPGETIAFTVRRPALPYVRVTLPAEHDARKVFEIDVPVAAITPVVLRIEAATTVHTIEASWMRTDVATNSSAIRSRRDGEHGGFAFEVEPGRYRLRLNRPRDGERNDTFLLPRMTEIEVVDHGPPIEIAVQHGGRLRVLVRDQNGLGQDGGIRLIDDTGKESLPWLSSDPGHSDGDGQFNCTHGPSETIENLVPGRYEVILDLGTAGIVKRSVEVKACEVTEIRVDVP